MTKAAIDYSLNVFINCPFDDEYRPLFEAIVFAVRIAGFRPRCALEAGDAGQVRLDKIMSIISECNYGVHDISRTEPNRRGLPRFNMPLELGLDLGCRKFGSARQKGKSLLIMDRTRRRYQQFISDISGQDVVAHGGSPRAVIGLVRDWLRGESRRNTIPGGEYMRGRYAAFRRKLPVLCESLRLGAGELTFVDLDYTMQIWLEENET